MIIFKSSASNLSTKAHTHDAQTPPLKPPETHTDCWPIEQSFNIAHQVLYFW